MPGGGAGAPRHRQAQRPGAPHRVPGETGGAEKPQGRLFGTSPLRGGGFGELFVQDLYAALKSGASALVLEHWERCHAAVLPMVGALLQRGEVPLSRRYAEQKGMLVEIGTGPGARGGSPSLSAGGKYLFLLTDQPVSKLADAFGAPFLSALDDLCQTHPFTEEALEEIARRELEDLGGRCQRQLQMALSFGEGEVKALAGAFTPNQGAYALKAEADKLYRAPQRGKAPEEPGPGGGPGPGERRFPPGGVRPGGDPRPRWGAGFLRRPGRGSGRREGRVSPRLWACSR